jgi:DHA2 family multidrug resistance protein
LTWLGLSLFLDETHINQTRRFDLLGFTFLSIGIGALQMMLDRGQTLNWFASKEVMIEAGLSALCLYLFIAHMFTHPAPYIEPGLFKDRNFGVGLLFIFIVGVILLATMALLPPFLQNLFDYPVIDVGVLLAPRGIGTMFAMFAVGRLSGKLDLRYMIGGGLLLTCLSLYEMTLFNGNISGWDLVRTGIIQGLGLGFIFVPLSTITFATLAPHYRNEGTALFSLMRNIGSSIGISIVMTLLAQNIQSNHAAYAAMITSTQPALRHLTEIGAINLNTATGMVSLNHLVNAQAAMLSYLQDFRFMMWITVIAMPLLFVLKGAPKPAPAKQAA